MILLTGFISTIAILASWTAIDKNIKAYYIFMLLLEIGMMGVFLAQDLFLFYIFWEFTLVPMYFLIGIWGGSERVYASIKFFLYTMAGSLLMLLAILYMGITNNSFSVPDLIRDERHLPTHSIFCSLVLPLPLPSKCRFSPSTPGCLMPIRKRQRPVLSF